MALWNHKVVFCRPKFKPLWRFTFSMQPCSPYSLHHKIFTQNQDSKLRNSVKERMEELMQLLSCLPCNQGLKLWLPRNKVYADSEDKQDKTLTQASCIYLSVKEKQIQMEQQIFFSWASVWNLLFLPGSTKPPVSIFCMYALRISMLWSLAADSTWFSQAKICNKRGFSYPFLLINTKQSHRAFQFSSTP